MSYPINEASVSTQIYSTPHGKRALSPSFQPGPYDVICARGKNAHSHPGNRRFRELVKLHHKTYSAAATKYQKSQIVSYITNIVRQSSADGGGFVKLFDGVWHEVGDRAAKEKIGQTMRDFLHTKYSSSTKAKARVRIQKRVQEYHQEGEGMATTAAADHVQSSVSVVSTDSIEGIRPNTIPSHIEVEMPPLKTPQLGRRMMLNHTTLAAEPSGEALLDALFLTSTTTTTTETTGTQVTDPFPLEPLPFLNPAIPVEFSDESDLEESMGEGALLDFCSAMGVAC